LLSDDEDDDLAGGRFKKKRHTAAVLEGVKLLNESKEIIDVD
jgi:hypothetical protein